MPAWVEIMNVTIFFGGILLVSIMVRNALYPGKKWIP